MIGPVHEKDTSVRVNAIRKMLSNPPVFDARLSTELLHDDGNVSSNHPEKDNAKTTSKRKKSILNKALVANEFSEDAPKIAVIASPKAKYMMIIERP